MYEDDEADYGLEDQRLDDEDFAEEQAEQDDRYGYASDEIDYDG